MTLVRAALWPLRGSPAPSADAIRTRPIVVKVGNDPQARPQTGIGDADLIIEVPVEGGLTRLAPRMRPARPPLITARPAAARW